jgi:hypothetical protein
MELPEEFDATRYRGHAKADNSSVEQCRKLAQFAVRCGFTAEGAAAIAKGEQGSQYLLPMELAAENGFGGEKDPLNFYLQVRNPNGFPNRLNVGREIRALLDEKQVSDPVARALGFIDRAWGEIAGEHGELNPQIPPAQALTMIPGVKDMATDAATRAIATLK